MQNKLIKPLVDQLEFQSPRELMKLVKSLYRLHLESRTQTELENIWVDAKLKQGGLQQIATPGGVCAVVPMPDWKLGEFKYCLVGEQRYWLLQENGKLRSCNHSGYHKWSLTDRNGYLEMFP